MSAAHGGRIVLSATTAELWRGAVEDAEVVDLGFHRLRDVTEPVSVAELRLVGRPQEFPALRSLGRGGTPAAPDQFVRNGGRSQGVQLWVSLPAAQKMTDPRYQALTGDNLVMLWSPDGGALVRLIAGDLAGHAGPGATPTPITHAHASVSPGARLTVPWVPEFNAVAYVLTGRGEAGDERRPIGAGQLVVLGPGDAVTVFAADEQPEDSPNLEVLVLGGLPIREPFLMNTRAENRQAIEDFNAGRMGRVPVSSA